MTTTNADSSNRNINAVSANVLHAASASTGGSGENENWSRGGRQFANSREVYTRSLYRVCLKFTTSEDEDEGKPEPGTAFWTLYGRQTTIGNGPPSSNHPDDICRRMDDSMTGPSAGILARLSDHDGEQAAGYALRAGMTTGWHIRGDRGDAAVRVGKAKVFSGKNGPDGPTREAQILSLDADRWILCKGASFAAGNSVFNVEDVNEGKQKITIHCSKGPMRGRLIDIHASRCPFVFGRAHEADLCIMDRELSRKHGAIVYLPNRSARGARLASIGNFVLVDLESTNGSYMRLVGPYGYRGIGSLAIGDEFIVGRTGFSLNRFDYGISEAIGARPTMEDRTIVVQSLLYEPQHGYYKNETKDTLQDLAMTTFAAVFDGHGGDECSNYLVETLPHQIRNHMYAEKSALSAAIESSRSMARPEQATEDAASELMRKILKKAYLKTDKDFITPKNAPQSGSTAATLIIMGRRLFAANVGDSRVVLCRVGGQCVELTSDHKPSRPDEAARVRAAGGFILHKRVMGELAITRAFGDKSFKMGIKAMLEDEADEIARGLNENSETKDLTAPLVSAEPEIASLVMSHNDEFLLLACDGLFDVFRSQDAIALARQELIAHRGEPAEVARILSDQAIRVRRSRDNVSILIIVLRPFWEMEKG
uniref:PPM-type phosphatase domain-containing protein n=1 Tax=Pseudo-nitzschia australis TaxID=44445 RepID=A0A7S4A9R9_9STRA|mmetsp:Transcript_6813/g.14502  ORF Transcript_6813/g.14502 Transcript_6813/m.14502 type:complete len:653 (-) Transcript_6813:789-2747(-)|eukprot:CAMPEP_0168177076 /NCGR_PEP_ID=MMETSP0139_2-20121125/8210_1 /TAXON_ID=44445 /ORGANISM="Pseudo-nitzschia australis, Strain 10249 10 AB" /LENGTH=652 /DNA_ID=CAMNT_0008096001 /DNA_START=508 /DNA_END=2466 /DNA_ORIENTATION=-